MSSTTPTTDSSDRFIVRLETLDTGGRARLKRNAGRTLDEARDAYQVFFSLLPQAMQPWDQENYFLVATLYAFGTRRENPRPRNPPRSLGASLRIVRQSLRGSDSDDRSISLDRRFGALLEADREQLPFRLRQIISLLAAHEVAADWTQLLRDVRRWTIGNGKVQRRWAEHYFVGTMDTSEPAAEATSEVSVVSTTKE